MRMLLLGLLTPILLSAGCATCTGNAYTDSTACILLNEKALKSYNARLRKTLNTLSQSLKQLDFDLEESKFQLYKVNKKLETASIPAEKLAMIKRENEKLQKQTKELTVEIKQSELRRTTLEKRLAETKIEDKALEEEVKLEQERTEQMKTKLKLVQAEIRDSIEASLTDYDG